MDDQTFGNHSPGCFRQWVVRIDWESHHVHPMPTFRQRWDCPECAVHKLAEKTRHIVATNSEVVSLMDAPQKQTTKRANKKRLGYLSLSLSGTSSKLYVADPRLFPSLTPYPSAGVIHDVIEYAVDEGVKRFSVNHIWQAPQEDARCLVFPTMANSHQAVADAIREAGYPRGKWHGESVADVEFKVRRALEPRAGFNW